MVDILTSTGGYILVGCNTTKDTILMKHSILIIGLIISLNLSGQKNTYPFVSDLEGKSNVEKVTLFKYRIVYDSDEFILNDSCEYFFDPKGRIFFSNYSNVKLIDSLVYDTNGNLIESYRYRPDKNTLESKYLMKYNISNILVEKKLFDGDGNILCTHSLSKESKNYKNYSKIFNDGRQWVNEYYYNNENFKVKFTITENDSITHFESYEYDNKDQLAAIQHHNHKGEIIAITSYVYDDQGNILIESMRNIVTGKIDHKYESTYDLQNNKLSDKNSFISGNIHTFKYEYKYDENGNWIEQTVYRGSKKSDIYERQIQYR
jgi:hypothetical protein